MKLLLRDGKWIKVREGYRIVITTDTLSFVDDEGGVRVIPIRGVTWIEP